MATRPPLVTDLLLKKAMAQVLASRRLIKSVARAKAKSAKKSAI
jgi:hypothetical protein